MHVAGKQLPISPMFYDAWEITNINVDLTLTAPCMKIWSFEVQFQLFLSILFYSNTRIIICRMLINELNRMILD